MKVDEVDEVGLGVCLWGKVVRVQISGEVRASREVAVGIAFGGRDGVGKETERGRKGGRKWARVMVRIELELGKLALKYGWVTGLRQVGGA